MYMAMIRVGDGMLQPIGCNFSEKCKYLPAFPEIEYCLAWLKDSGYEWHFIAQVGFNYEPGCLVMKNDELIKD